MDELKELFRGFFEKIAGSFMIGVLLAFPVMWCWNYIMPLLFSLPILNLFDAWILLILSNLLFKSGASQ